MAAEQPELIQLKNISKNNEFALNSSIFYVLHSSKYLI